MIDAADLLDALEKALAEAGIEAVLIGGHAVNVWLEPRFTADIDLTVAADPAGLAKLRSALEARGWEVRAEYGGQQSSGPDFIRYARRPDEPVVELQVAKTAFQNEVIGRAAVGRWHLPVATVEDLLVMKLIAFRAKDRIDLEGLALLPDVDWDYVERWAAVWEVAERLADLRARLP